MPPISPQAKTLTLLAAIVALGAPTAGATMKIASAPATAPPPESAGGVLKIELTVPREPEVKAIYPLETFEAPPVNEFRSGPGRGRAWRIGFDYELEPRIQEAEPQGDQDMAELELEPEREPELYRPSWTPERERRASYEETVRGWGIVGLRPEPLEIPPPFGN
jgi:hypothetical protein